MAQGPVISKRTVLSRIAPLVALLLVAAACTSAASPSPQASAPAASTAPASVAPASAAATPDVNSSLILATTTSTQDSGLLDVLVPAFEQATGYVVKTVSVGSGQALKMGQEGNADVLLVHSPAAEKTFMDDGWGVDRRLVMHNYFQIVGPKDDPAGIRGMTSAADAFKKIADSGSTFVSRGDGSGTEAKELAIWKTAGITPAGNTWYLQSGQGMGPTLQIASEKGAYTLTDNATFLSNSSKLALEVLVQGDPVLLNIYHVISVNPEKWPKVNIGGATAFSDFLTSPAGQELIGSFGSEYGQPLFIPDAGKADSDVK
ncbi:MAG: substrate-binding domain-containing protein [Chloroflexota bacterium]